MTNETEIDTIVIDKGMKFGDLLFCDCCYIGICLLYSPRVWRWSLPELIFKSIRVSILHVCGGDPLDIDVPGSGTQYSPRVWRWSRL